MQPIYLSIYLSIYLEVLNVYYRKMNEVLIDHLIRRVLSLYIGMFINGTVSTISSDPLCKVCNY